jgi:3-hydroxymyristoyl/3-hydroxydecanoyl-(acyl carrier protein) dehydratase
VIELGSDATALPHRPPFLFVSRITQLGPGIARAEWDVTGSEAFLQGHFPGNPLVPGVLLGEALAQTAGIALGCVHELAHLQQSRGDGFLARIELRFFAPVRPPATVLLSATHTHTMGALHQFDALAECNGARAAQGSLVLSIPTSAASGAS